MINQSLNPIVFKKFADHQCHWDASSGDHKFKTTDCFVDYCCETSSLALRIRLRTCGHTVIVTYQSQRSQDLKPEIDTRNSSGNCLLSGK